MHIFSSNKEVIVPLKKIPSYIINKNKEKKSLFIREAGNMHIIGHNNAANQEESNLRMYHQPFIKIFHCIYKEVNVLNFGFPGFH